MKKLIFLLTLISFYSNLSFGFNRNFDKIDETILGIKTEIKGLPLILKDLEKQKDTTILNRKIETLWSNLKTNNTIPWISNDTIVFLYKGNAKTVHFVGDFTSWRVKSSFSAKQIGKTDFWYLVKTYPLDARLDYKIVVDEKDWLLDPNNSKVQYSGFGPNSSFAMPKYEPSRYISKIVGVPSGEIHEHLILSASVGSEVRFWVYTPSNYTELKSLPTIYVTDGQEYMDSRMGAMSTILDNLINQELIKPVLAIYVDPINPQTDENERQTLFLNSEDYAELFTAELIPFIDKHYKTDTLAKNRAILGTSYGGNNACWFAHKLPDSFKLIAAQSPSLPTHVLSLLRSSDKIQVDKFFISTGTVNDTENYADELSKILSNKNVYNKYKKVNEGHSWGNWSALLDDILIYFFGI